MLTIAQSRNRGFLRSLQDGNLQPDDGKPKALISGYRVNMAAVVLARRYIDGQQAFAGFLMRKNRNGITPPERRCYNDSRTATNNMPHKARFCPLQEFSAVLQSFYQSQPQNAKCDGITPGNYAAVLHWLRYFQSAQLPHKKITAFRLCGHRLYCGLLSYLYFSKQISCPLCIKREI